MTMLFSSSSSSSSTNPNLTNERCCCWHRLARISQITHNIIIITIIIIISISVEASSSHSNDNPAIIVPVRSQQAAANWHEPRIELRYNSRNRFVNLDERSPNNTVVAIVIVSDEDTGPSGETSLSIENGNEFGHFKLVVTQFSNTIQVNGAPLSRQDIPEYNLTLVARDRGSPQRVSAVNLMIKITSSPASIQSPLEPPTVFKPPPVSDLIYAGTMLVILFSASVFFIIIGCALVQKPRGKKPAPLSGGTATTTTTTTTGSTTTGTTNNWNANLDLYSL